jgi:site-specific DNA recombinase
MTSKKPIRLDAYVRVSRIGDRDAAGESFITVDEQKRKIGHWAAAHGHEIVRTWEELDVSGSKTDRPMLNEVMRRIEAGETDGMVVATLDRFSRSLMGALVLLKRIDEAGGVFAAVDGNVDLTTDTGRAFVQILFVFAELEWRRRKGYWSDARRNAVDRGIVVSPTAFGYKRDAAGRYAPDPDTAWVVTEMFERRAAGETYTAIRDWANSCGVLPQRGSGWSAMTIRQMLANPTYLGTIRSGEFVREGSHPPLVSPVTFEAASRRRPRRQPYGDVPLLRGLVRCSGCRYTMQWYGNRSRGDMGPLYRCTRSDHTGDCPAPSTIVAKKAKRSMGLEDYVRDQAFARLPSGFPVESPTDVDIDLDGLEREVKLAEADLAAYAGSTAIMRAAGEKAFAAGLDTRREAMEAAQSALDEARRRAGVLQTMRDPREDWESMSPLDRNEWLASMIQVVFVRQSQSNGRGSITGASPGRVHIVWADEPPLDLPRQGRRDYVMRSFVFADETHDDPGVVLS